MMLGLVSPAGKIGARSHQSTEADQGPDHVIERIKSGIINLCTQASLPPENLSAIGVAVAGAVDITSGTVLDGQNLHWQNIPLRARLSSSFRGVEISVDNDVNAAAWGEHVRGAGRDCPDMLAVWVGTGIGGGLILNDCLYHGGFSTAGEIGLTVSNPDGKQGHLTVEDFAGREGMRRFFEERFADEQKSLACELTSGDPERLSTGIIREAYQRGDATTHEIVNRGAHILGVAIANVVSILSLPRVVIGGGITEALGEPYLERIRSSFHDAVFPDRCRECELVITELASDAGMLGAALLARKAFDHCSVRG